MRRLYRLMAPAVAFTAIGTMLLLLTSSSVLELRGGLATSAAYALAIQIALALLLVSAVDDLEDPRLITPKREGSRVIATRAGRTARPFATKHPFISFYLWYPAAALLLALGVSMTIAALAIGLLDRMPGIHMPYLDEYERNSEVALVAVLAATALPQLFAGGRGFFGWAVGFAAGTAIAQTALDPSASLYRTAVGWFLYAAILCAVGIAWYGVRRFVHGEGG